MAIAAAPVPASGATAPVAETLNAPSDAVTLTGSAASATANEVEGEAAPGPLAGVTAVLQATVAALSSEPFYWDREGGGEAGATAAAAAAAGTTGADTTVTAAVVVSHHVRWLALQLFTGMEYVGEVFAEFLGMTGSRYDWALEAAEQMRVRFLRLTVVPHIELTLSRRLSPIFSLLFFFSSLRRRRKPSAIVLRRSASAGQRSSDLQQKRQMQSAKQRRRRHADLSCRLLSPLCLIRSDTSKFDPSEPRGHVNCP